MKISSMTFSFGNLRNVWRGGALFAFALRFVAPVTWAASSFAVAPGQIDGSFAKGIVETHAGGGSIGVVAGVLGDGGVLVSATYNQDWPLPGTGTFVTSYLPNGTLAVPISQQNLPFFYAKSMCRAASGEVFITGLYSGAQMAVCRLNPDGTFNPSYGVNGFVLLNEGFSSELALQFCSFIDDYGRLYLVGHSNDWDVGVVTRLLPNGMVDSTFAGGELAHVSFKPSSAALQADGKLVIVGNSMTNGPSASSSRFAVARLLPDGSPDAGFGVSGSLIWNVSAADMLRDVMVQGDGKIVAVGSSNGQQVVIRLTETGSLDSSFDADGYSASLGFPKSNASRCVLGLDGRIIVAGQHSTTLEESELERHILCYGQDGTLYPEFGNGGRVDLGSHANGTSLFEPRFAADKSFVSIVNGGKILLGFEAWDKWAGGGRYSLLRLMPDGRVDDTYGDGMVRLGADSFNFNRSSRTIKLEPSGRILVPSVTSQFNVEGYSEVHALMPDGTPDPSFGLNGRLRLNGFPEDHMYGDLLALRPDGRFILGGRHSGFGSLMHSGRLSNGAVDPSYNSGEIVQFAVGPTLFATGLILDSSNRTITLGSGSFDVMINRHLEDGSPDITFGQGDGAVVSDFGEREFASSLALQPDGKLLVGGYSTEFSTESATCMLLRYQQDGTLDETFGVNGRADLSALETCTVTDMKVLPDGRLLLTLRRLLPPFGAPLLVALWPNGVLDASFGSSGVATSNNIEGGAYALAVQKDGRIVISGNVDSETVSQAYDVMVARYESSGSIDASFGNNGWVRIPLCQGRNLGSAIVIQPDNRLLINAYVLEQYDDYKWVSSTVVMRLQGGPLLANLSQLAPSDRSETGARLRGHVNPNGFTTDVVFEYGPTSAYGNSIPVSLSDPDGMVPEEVSVLLSGLAPRSTYHYRITATTAAGVRSTPDGVFSTYSSLESWRQTHFGSALNAGTSADTADDDQDGLQNLLEWVLGSSPVQTSPWTASVVLNGSEIEFSYLRDTNAVGGQTQVEWSDDLAATEWSNMGVTEMVVGQSGTIQTIKASLPAGNTGHRFVRLRVQGPP